MIRRTRVDLFDTDLIVVTTGAEHRRTCRRLAPDHDPVPWHSVGLVTEFHSGDGSDGAPEYVLLIGLDERIHASDMRHFRKVVIHEATHAGGMLLDHVAEEYDGTSETLAHLVAYIADWLLDVLDAALTNPKEQP
jgi:hypothetical protein